MAVTLRNPLDLGETWHRNLSAPALVEAALARNEGVLTADGALVVDTGEFTGRSPRDRFIVSDPSIDPHIAWGGINQPFPAERFDELLARAMDHLRQRDAFVFDGFAGADPDYRMPLRVITELRVAQPVRPSVVHPARAPTSWPASSPN